MSGTTAKPTSFMAAMKHFFGLAPNQNLVQFGAELKALSSEDKEYFRVGLVQNGYDLPAAA